MKIKEIDLYLEQFIEEFTPYKGEDWCYEDGIILLGYQLLYQVDKNPKYLDFIMKYHDEHIDDDGLMFNYNQENYNIDNINPGKVLFDVYKESHEIKYKKVMDRLFHQLKNHPRTKSGSFWHKKRYPNQIWLDGLYMAQPVYARYIIEFLDDEAILDDVIHQFSNVRRYLFDKDTQLYDMPMMKVRLCNRLIKKVVNRHMFG